MILMDICKAYGEMHGLGTKEVFDLYLNGNISQYELMNSFLENEGIFGYTQKIITAMRCVYVVK